jgi:hypothetical protein
MRCLAIASLCSLTEKKFWTKLRRQAEVVSTCSRGEPMMFSFANASGANTTDSEALNLNGLMRC